MSSIKQPDCLFCQIASGQTATELVWQNEVAVAFADIHPSAPIHLLVVPKRHVDSLDTLDDPRLGGRLLEAVKVVAGQAGAAGAYRMQINVGRPAGQVIDHLHLHILAGRRFVD